MGWGSHGAGQVCAIEGTGLRKVSDRYWHRWIGIQVTTLVLLKLPHVLL